MENVRSGDIGAAPGMAQRIQGHDWSAGSLGPPEAWPSALGTALDIALNSRQPMFLAWGPELSFLYNDAYAAILGSKHPHALGRPFREVWGDIWEDIGHLVERALDGEASWAENLPLTMDRQGYAEQTWWTFSYSP